MKGIFKKKLFWIIIILIIVIAALIILLNNNKIDGGKGGIIDGKSHKEGGVKGRIKDTMQKIELEGGEAVLTKRVGQIKDKFICEGTPEGIASAINKISGGVEFDENGSCIIKR